MKSKLIKPIFGFILMVLLGLYSVAQENQNPVSVKITKEIDGEEKTFEQTYDSEEDMREDDALKDFMGQEDDLAVWFSENHKGPGIIELEAFEDGRPPRFFFGFGPDAMEMEHFMIDGDSIRDSIRDSIMKAHGIEMKEMSEVMRRELKEHMKELHRHHGYMRELKDDTDFDFDFDFTDSVDREVREKLGRLHHGPPDHIRNIEVRIIKEIRISDDVSEFGKKGTVKNTEKLALDDLKYFPNPAPNGRFRLTFSTEGTGDLSVKIFNLDGKEVFSRYLSNYAGRYSESIDLSRQSEGIYLLEIQHDGKRLTRKIAINQ